MHVLRPLFRSVIVLLALVALRPVHAQVSSDCVNEITGQPCGKDLNTITTAVPFLMISVDSRAGGMGDAGVAISPDVNAIHWNPAKLAFAPNDGEFAISFSPWLRNLVPDMSLAYLAGYGRLGNKRSTIGGSLRYFDLGSIQFTDATGQPIREFKPAEFAVDIAFAQQFSDFFSGGIAVRYVNSNLTGGLNVNNANTKAGQTVAADVSVYYQKPELQLGDKTGTFAFGLNISNIGAKMSYSETAKRDFIPMNLRLGPRFTYNLDDYNSISIHFDANKLLVPTPPIYAVDSSGNNIVDPATGEFQIASGKNPDVGVAQGLFQSFSDAPGFYGGDGELISGSNTKEEFREINLGGGLEYWYAKQFAVRAGYFWEHYTKGNRKYFTLGAGVRYSIFSIDLSYLIANTQRSPLANTLRFTLGFNFDKSRKKKNTEE
ncbi:MAG: type IX secretion system outer membrane channel protein PorV [Flavobacteriales bacterium]|nr:type IX secretion system outer membrane channel protein PorV [Flavobacteriales bacterium]MBK9076429.1 type IX secretion system outer membrane channel protein PorV [Flavobacteriales bacterium]MBK9539487.1 type IX secretion system outer membrane channel protein PorV [Flavobacteriales bacterium]